MFFAFRYGVRTQIRLGEPTSPANLDLGVQKISKSSSKSKVRSSVRLLASSVGPSRVWDKGSSIHMVTIDQSTVPKVEVVTGATFFDLRALFGEEKFEALDDFLQRLPKSGQDS